MGKREDEEEMKHMFDVDIAVAYGIPEAIIFENIAFWVEKNAANDCNFYDDNYWTFNSVKAFTELFPYLSKKNIEVALHNLEKNELIVTGNYNKLSMDRTKWYALTNKGKMLRNADMTHFPYRINAFPPQDKCISPNGTMDFPHRGNAFPPQGKPIPYINTYINTDINTDIVEQSSTEISPPYAEIIDYLNNVTGKRYKSTARAAQKLIRARWNEGYTIDDFKVVISNMNDAWKDDAKMRDYIRPHTLFGTKFDAYLNRSKNTNPAIAEDENDLDGIF